MQASSRIVVNTLAQYIRTIINLVLSLYSSRLVLNILGVEDYGVYALVAGVVSMLSFVTNSLVGSTQRFLSVCQGQGNIARLKEVFGNSLILHVFIGLLVTIILEVLTPFLFDGFLNIPSDRTEVAKILYQCVVIMVYISFIAAPYKALLVSRENIVYTSIIDVLDGILKVVLVLILPFMAYDKLVAYGFIMLSIQVFNLAAYAIYSHVRYEEAVVPDLKLFRFAYIKDLSSFTGWMVYSSVCVTMKTQGVAVVLNKALGTVVNAAYGIGLQISGMVSFVSSSLNNAIAPQLMSAEGRGDRKHMYFLAEVESKFSFLLLAMIGIPTMFEMPVLLKFWLGDTVPSYTVLFSCTLLFSQIIDMLSTGLALANRAIGRIGFYTVMTYSPKLLVLPISWTLLKLGQSLWTVCAVIVFFETFCMIVRIWLFRREEGFDIVQYFYSVILRSMIPVVVSCFVSLLVHNLVIAEFRFILTYILSFLSFAVVTYFCTLTVREKNILISLLSRLIKITDRDDES